MDLSPITQTYTGWHHNIWLWYNTFDPIKFRRFPRRKKKLDRNTSFSWDEHIFLFTCKWNLVVVILYGSASLGKMWGHAKFCNLSPWNLLLMGRGDPPSQIWIRSKRPGADMVKQSSIVIARLDRNWWRRFNPLAFGTCLCKRNCRLHKVTLGKG